MKIYTIVGYPDSTLMDSKVAAIAKNNSIAIFTFAVVADVAG
jgi:hypothetical protein